MIRIGEALAAFVDTFFPKLEKELRMAQIGKSPSSFVVLIIVLSLIIAVNLSVITFLLLLKAGMPLLIFPAFFLIWLISILIVRRLPQLYIAQVRRDIEKDIFVPARMLLTLIESGNSLISAFEGVSFTRAKSSKYFGKIASEIYLGKNIDQALEDAMRYTPSESFRRILDPISKSMKTGTDIHKSLLSTIEQISQEKVVEIEQYEKRLNAISMFYMLFGTIIPSVGIVAGILLLAVTGIKIKFFPFLLIFAILIFAIQLFFIRLFKGIRPLMDL